MNYIAERRLEEKERRRQDILDAAEQVAASEGWEAVTMDQVARKARLSRALVYVYFKDKNDLMFALDHRALVVLKQKFMEVIESQARGIDRIEGFGRAYMSLSQEQPVYFDVLSRCEQVTVGDVEADSNMESSLNAANGVFGLMEEALQLGIQDGTVRPDIGSPRVVAITLWAFLHGAVLIATNKQPVLGLLGVAEGALTQNALDMALRSLMPAAASKRKSR